MEEIIDWVFRIGGLIGSYLGAMSSDNPIVLVLTVGYLAVGGAVFFFIGFGGNIPMLILGATMLFGAFHCLSRNILSED